MGEQKGPRSGTGGRNQSAGAWITWDVLGSELLGTRAPGVLPHTGLPGEERRKKEGGAWPQLWKEQRKSRQPFRHSHGVLVYYRPERWVLLCGAS